MPAAFAVHQLRYLLAYGSGAGIELQRTGHSYLHSAGPWLVALIALWSGVWLRRLGRACSGHVSPAGFALSFAGLWLTSAATLVAIFAGQELLEGALATGHAPGLVGVFGYGGWWAIPVAGCLGLMLAAVFHGARWVTERVAARARGHCAHASAAQRSARPVPARQAGSRAPLASGWSDRGPPLLSA